MFLRSDDNEARRVEKLTRISDVLVERIDRLEESRGSAWSMFQAAVALEQEVQARTRDLEKALADLSDRNRELAVARAFAEEANRSKTRFLRAASHDLLQPLSAAKLFLSALQDTAQDELQTELSQRLAGAFESVEELMHAVLDISRLDSQRIEFQRKPVHLGEMFQRLAVEYLPMAQAKGLRLRFIPTMAVVESDPTFLRRIAQNLISNAIKYTDQGGVLVGARKRGESVWLEVFDTGIGIAAHDRARIFNEFHRISRDGGAPGMGLGLSIVRRACAKLGHPIAMDSEPGRGTVFRVSLPLVTPESRVIVPAALQSGPCLRGRVALVVENDAAMRRALQLLLRDRLGMVARVTGGTAEALAEMGDDPPDVVIADYNLDNGDTGLQAIAALRRAVGQPVPAIIITARRDPEIGRAGLEMGALVLEKPLRPDELQAALQHMLA
ncbi:MULTISPECIES: hybrid sensor histidine kinase/response regulator [Paracoccus]|uniref:histidine kinase n=1 Tax=Paracoccus litorisediminis TaxID=2006130 RepID=A0A844HIU9_9RHOB|nr:MULTISPECIES: hybrid sensor histidine kinase/response regulator [Paracoccus]MBD9526549.1 hybrid sensor histidine kinase/response regulator [Paracoccus sp. PAR01]MTH58949.1 response regulator [Paracoccus litorisediminis]